MAQTKRNAQRPIIFILTLVDFLFEGRMQAMTNLWVRLVPCVDSAADFPCLQNFGRKENERKPIERRVGSPLMDERAMK